MKAIAFVDGSDRMPGCNCGPECSMPCWQRVGIAPACDACGCAAFAADPDPNDRAATLRQSPDLWAEIEPHLAQGLFDAVEVVLRGEFADPGLEAKFRKGEAEHGRDWLDMTREQLEREIHHELQDMRLYCAMIRARFGAGNRPNAQ